MSERVKRVPGWVWLGLGLFLLLLARACAVAPGCLTLAQAVPVRL